MSELSHLRTASLPVVLDRFLLEQQIHNRSPRTVDGFGYKLGRLVIWCQERGVTSVSELTAEVLQGYRRYLFHYRIPKTGQPLKAASQSQHLMAVRKLCRWLVKTDVLKEDPSHDLQLPKLARRTLGEVLTLDEVNLLLIQPDVRTPMGIRDRAILETFYSTAMRASELSALALFDIHRERKLIHVRHGKGAKDRLTPIGSDALQWIETYLRDVRPSLVRTQSGQTIFIGQRGEQLSRCRLAQLVRKYLRQAGIEKAGACHIIRHTAATLMLENGADLRSLQTYLGHERLDTTQLYTHMTLGRLKEVHEKTHPTGDQRLGRKRQDDNRGDA